MCLSEIKHIYSPAMLRKVGFWCCVDIMTEYKRLHNMPLKIVLVFYRSSIKSLLTYCVSTWYGSCTEADRVRFQRAVKAAQRIVGCPLSSLIDIYSNRCLSRARNITKDSSNPTSQLFELLPSGRRYRSFQARTNRLRNSFFLKAINTLNSHM